MRAIWRAAGLIGGLLTADTALAQETAVYWGVDLTSNYVFDGLTQTNGDFAFQPWVELEYNGFYAGAWASTVDLGTDNWELDLYLGYRDTLDSGLFWSVGYARYFYDDTGDCCGEIKLELAYPVLPTFTLGTQISFNPETDAWNRKVLASYDVSEQLSVSGLIGKSDGSNTEYWDLGASWKFNETVSADLRYYGADIGDEGVVFTLGLSF